MQEEYFKLYSPNLSTDIEMLAFGHSGVPVLDGYYNEDAYFNNPVDLLPNDSNPELWQMKIVLLSTLLNCNKIR